MKRFLLFTLVIGLFAVQANAGMYLRLNDGVNPIMTIADNGIGDTDLTAGKINYSATIGVWTVNVTGYSKPFIGGPTMANLDLLSGLVSSLAGGTITVELTDTDYSLPVSMGPNVSIISEIGGTTDGTLDFEQRYDPDNSEWAATIPGNDTLLTSPTMGSGSFSDTQTASAVLVNPFSLYEKVVVSHSGSSTKMTSFDAESIVVPVPGAVLLGILGLGAAGWKLRKFA